MTIEASVEPDAKYWPSGLNASAVTASPCWPSIILIGWFFSPGLKASRFQTATLPLARPAKSRCFAAPRGLEASDLTGWEWASRPIGPAYFSSHKQTVPSVLADAANGVAVALVYATATAVISFLCERQTRNGL